MPLYKHIGAINNAETRMIIPVPAFNVLNGGSHSGSSLPFQELMIVPTGSQTFSHAMQVGSEVYAALKAVITEQYGRSGTCTFMIFSN